LIFAVTQWLVPQPGVFLWQMSADMYTDIFDRERYSLSVLVRTPNVLLFFFSSSGSTALSWALASHFSF
jgi:hypothetical protein